MLDNFMFKKGHNMACFSNVTYFLANSKYKDNKQDVLVKDMPIIHFSINFFMDINSMSTTTLRVKLYYHYHL